MARTDERGVVVPAPLQGSGAALAGPKYGDKYRGPAVTEAYELSRCWIDLAGHSEEWPTPESLPPGMVAFAQAIPEDQRADWLRRQANNEEVDRRISYAIRCGDLPIWVAPIGEPDRLIAPDALATIDSRSIKTGTFFPLSEEYKSEQDRPWLWERPLFVKWDDWVSFVAKTRAEKMPSVVSKANDADGKPIEEFSADAGWIKGLPNGWIDGFICARRIYRLLKQTVADDDPAPWLEVADAEYWGAHWGKSAAEYTYGRKMDARVVSIFQRAIGAGELVAFWFDGSQFEEVPRIAMDDARIADSALRNGGLEVDPLWPDLWQHWSNEGWAIPKKAFDDWVAAERPLTLNGLPYASSGDPDTKVVQIASRLPTNVDRIPLAEAVSWIAFGTALDAERLSRAVDWARLCRGDLQLAQQQLEQAAALLFRAGADDRVAIFGRHVERDDSNGQLTKRIEPLTLEDYQQFLIFDQDQLRYGKGPGRWFRAPNDTEHRGSSRRDFYSNVTVSRADLLSHFAVHADADGDKAVRQPGKSPADVEAGKDISPSRHVPAVRAWPVYEGRSYAWPIWEAVEYVRGVIGDRDEENHYSATLIAIRQAALDGHISIFGKRELGYPKAAGHHSDVWTRIKPGYWEANKLNRLSVEAEWQHHDHTWPEPETVSVSRERYWGLLVSRREIESHWSIGWSNSKTLFQHWRRIALRQFSALRDQADFEAIQANRQFEWTHLQQLMSAALQPVLDILEVAGEMEPPSNYHVEILVEAKIIYDHLARLARRDIVDREQVGATGLALIESEPLLAAARIERIVLCWNRDDLGDGEIPGQPAHAASPLLPSAQATTGGEHECRAWLLEGFASDPDKRRSKKSFQDAALAQFSGRLSVRGFLRVWDAVASSSGRSVPGRKS